MKILLVDAYSKTDHPCDKFVEFASTVREILQAQTEYVDKEDIKIFERTQSNLDDFLYEIDSSYVKKTAAKLFDHIDVIFMEGDVNLLPWHPFALKFNILLRMCIRAKKSLFASAFAMQSLVYLCATNIEKSIKVLNGKGRGGPISNDIANFQKGTENLTGSDYLLDNITGDLYTFRHDSSEWAPKVNVGIHHRRAAETFNSLGKFIIKQPVYKPKSLNDLATRYLGQVNEDYCTTKKIYLQHWAFQELSSEFKIPFKTHWDIHHFNFMNPTKTFSVLAESRTGPQVIHMEPNCIATYFPITKKYYSTVQILKNFILYNVRQVKLSMKQNPEGIEKATIKAKMSSYADDDININDAKSQTISHTLLKAKSSAGFLQERSRPQTAKPGLFPHSGYAIKKSDTQIIFENNTVRMDPPVDLKKASDFSAIWGQDRVGMIKPTSTVASRITSAATKRPVSNIRSMGVASVTDFDGNFSKAFIKVDRSRWTNERPFSPDTARDGQTFLKQTKSEDAFHKTKAEIRLMLYPDMAKDLLPQEEFWIPGNLSAKAKSRPQTANTMGKKTIRMEDSYSSKFYSRYQKDFKSNTQEESVDKPVVRCSSVYMTEEDRRRQDGKESSKKNLGPISFKFGGKATKPNYIPNYVGIDVTEPPVNHKFRNVSKEKWVGGQMRL